MASAHPKISVCMPTFNQARFLREAIESVLRQSCADLELIVSDDASTDDTRDIIADVRDTRLRYLRQPRNLGIAENRNRCLAAARGRYIAWLDSDDLYHADMLVDQSAVLDKLPNVGLVHGAYQLIDATGRRLPDWPLPFKEDVIEEGRQAISTLILGNYITAPTVLVRRQCHDRAGPYATDVGASSTDWDMWLRIAMHADLAFTARVVASYRQHPGSISITTMASGERLRADIRVIQKLFRDHRDTLPDSRVLWAASRTALSVKALLHSRDAVTLGRRNPALRSAALALRLCPPLRSSRHALPWLLAIHARKEHPQFVHSRALLQILHARLEGTALADRIRKVAVPNAEWSRNLRAIARIVRRVVPAGALVVAVDKWDPTLLHKSGRRGWHFPDRHAFPSGYPCDSASAIAHLEDLRIRGARFLVFPSSAFWWLDSYEGFRQHLRSAYTSMWSDDRCIIFDLSNKNGGELAGERCDR